MATAFTKENLWKSGDSIYYSPDGKYCWKNSIFIARFKYAAGSSKGPFMTWLRKNMTVEQWIAERDAGKSPGAIMDEGGFILSHIKKWLKRDGYAPTKEGYDAWMAARREERLAA